MTERSNTDQIYMEKGKKQKRNRFVCGAIINCVEDASRGRQMSWWDSVNSS